MFTKKFKTISPQKGKGNIFSDWNIFTGQSTTNLNDSSMNLLNEPPKQKDRNVIVDISKISAFTKTKKKNQTKGNPHYIEFQDLKSNDKDYDDSPFNKKTNQQFIHQEIIEEFIKEDESIKPHDLKMLKEKILDFFEYEAVIY